MNVKLPIKSHPGRTLFMIARVMFMTQPVRLQIDPILFMTGSVMSMIECVMFKIDPVCAQKIFLRFRATFFTLKKA
jgi:hypothetical protein